MSERVSLIDVTEDVDERASLLDLLRRVLLASVGVVAVAQEEVEALVDKLVERGEIADKDARGLMRDLRERRSQQLEQTRAEQEKRLDAILKRVNVPTKSDIDALSERIAHLSQQVDELLDASKE